jgi:murein L,D-transpeptidase YafK
MARAMLSRLAGLALAAAVLTGCQDDGVPKAIRPVSAELTAKMDQLGMKATAPIFLRIYKESSELEVWKERADGKYGLLKTYSICKWSGALGPKIKEGDRQAPEGFYTVTPAQMNPNSSYYLSFNIGYPNAYDRAYGRTGSNLMVHGACSSAGCYSMTDESAGEIFALARDAFKGGQTAFQIQAFPFRMTAENLAAHRSDPNLAFWKALKVGADHFEVTRVPPTVNVCNKAYVFNADAGTATFDASGPCPAYRVPDWIQNAVNAKEADDDKVFAKAAAGSALPAGAPSSVAAGAGVKPAAALATPIPAIRPVL